MPIPKPIYAPAAIAILLATLANGAEAEEAFVPDAKGFREKAVPLFEKHCFGCHGAKKQKGDFRIDEDLPNTFSVPFVAEKWGEVINVLNAEEMPPEDEPRPDPQQVEELTKWVDGELARADDHRVGSDIVLRRLNRSEYDNTIRNLTGLDLNLSNRFGFPEDPPAGGFDNIGSALMMSPLQMELYLDAATFLMDRLIVTGERPESIKWRVEFETDQNRGDRYREKFDGQNLIVNSGKNPIENGWTIIHHDSWNKVPGFRPFVVPYEGRYKVSVRAAGQVPSPKEVIAGAKQIYLDERDEKAWETAREHFESDWSYRYGFPRMRLESTFKNSQPVIWADIDVEAPVSEPEVYTFDTYFDTDGASLRIKNIYTIPRHLYNFWLQGRETYMDPEKHKHTFPRPLLYIDWLEIEGPILDAWPPESHRRILFDSPSRKTDESKYAREVLSKFMKRAFRRPATAEEIEKKLSIFSRVRPENPSFEQAIKQPLVAVLCSPQFLYITEPDPPLPSKVDSKKIPAAPAIQNPRALTSWELASRLSYFLWSSMPDDELFALAESAQLLDPDVLLQQTRRMLKDQKSKAFVRNFGGQWLGLRQIGANPPGQEYFPRYDRHLETSMRSESEAFFAEILDNDFDVGQFLKSDWSMLNERLARFYRVPGVKGDALRKVTPPPESHRGGVVTQASILAITSNGTRTSPVVRGKWILETLLGDPPPPPPPNVEEIPQPNVDAALPIRDRLTAHREQVSCARCHNKIDPLGFALENFDGCGEWRTHEIWDKYKRRGKKDALIDASAELPDGTAFDGVDGLRDVLVANKDPFLDCLAEKLGTYALGRELTRRDRKFVEGAAAHMKRNGQTLRSLVEFIVSSPQFHTK